MGPPAASGPGRNPSMSARKDLAPPPRWARWLVVAPITWVGASVLLVMGPLLAPVALLVDLADRGNWRALRLLRLGWTFCLLEVLALPAAFWVWATGPVASDQTGRYQRLLAWWLRTITAAIRRSLGFTFDNRFPETGDAPLIVVSRHAGPGDALFLMDFLANRQGRAIRSVGRTRLLWDPFFDHVGSGAGYVFLQAGEGVDRIRDGAVMPERGAFISFPEGGNYSAKRRQQAIERFRAAGDDVRAAAAADLDHLLLPRAGGVHAALMGAPEATVVLVGHAGYGDIDSFAGMWRAIPEGRAITLEGRVVDRPDGWQDRAAVAEWLLACWVDLDRWIHKRRDR